MGALIAAVPRSAVLSLILRVRPEVENDLAFTHRWQKFFLERFPGRRDRRKADAGDVRSGQAPAMPLTGLGVCAAGR